LVREWQGKLERVIVLEAGFAWNGKTYGSLSKIAKTITGPGQEFAASVECHRLAGRLVIYRFI